MTRSHKRSSASIVASFTLTLLAAFAANSQSARADIPPPDGCKDVGQACENAGDWGHFQEGTCVSGNCSRTLRKADGTFETMTTTCNHCVANDAGSPAAASSADAASAGIAGNAVNGANPTSVPPVQPAQKKDGCDLGASAPVPIEMAFGLVIALAVLPRKKRA